MFRMKPFWLGALAVFALSGHFTPARAQQDFSKVEIETIKLTDTLYMLRGAGGNIGVSAGEDGVYLIDDQYAPLTDKILAAVKAISDKPIRFVVNTHWHGDHTGGNENFGKGGAVIMAHDAVRVRMEKGQEMPFFDSAIPPAPKDALPDITYSGTATLYMNGEAARLIHVAPAHTDGDTLIHWPESNVIHVGDTFFNGLYPFVDSWSGGAVDGMIAAVDTVLDLANEKTKIIPGHGPLATKADLVQFREMLVTVRDRATAAKAAGKSAEDWAAEKPLADLEADWAGGFLTTDQFIKSVFAGL